MKTELIDIHKRLDGQCQKCGQRCDKSVVSFVAGDMVCPDCRQGKERPFFKPSARAVELVSIKNGWKQEETNTYLQFLPLGIALVKHDAESRLYWNWDKSKHIRYIETDHEGNFLKVVFYYKKKVPTRNIDGERVILQENTSLHLTKIHVPDEIKKDALIDEKIEYRLHQYKQNGTFGKQIIVQRTEHSKNKPFTLIDGYSIYLASKKLDIKVAPVFIAIKEPS